MSTTPHDIYLMPLPAGKLEHAMSLDSVKSSAGRYMEMGLDGSANTKRAYQGDVLRYCAWCSCHHLPGYPASVETLAYFLSWLAETGKRPATIVRHLAAISKGHQVQNLENPAHDPRIKVLLKGIYRDKGRKQRQAPALALHQFKQGLATLATDTPGGVRDRALLLLGFAGAFRRDELRRVRIEDLRFDAHALVISLRSSKTNQEGYAEEKAVFHSADPAACPVRATQAWLSLLGRDTGPLFVGLRAANQRERFTDRLISGQYINELVKRTFHAMGEKDNLTFTSHSLRATFVTLSKLNGAADSEIMTQTKHKSAVMIQRYTRLNDVRDHNSARKLGL